MTLVSDTGHWRRALTPVIDLVPALTALGLFAVLYAGWIASYEQPVTPKHGLGYWLGIAGVAMMAVLYGYYFRKRVARPPQAARSIPAWLRAHVILGSAGPVLILFHCNFRLGALNSNVALFSMGAVVVSGVVGRYLYRFAYRSRLAPFERVFGAWRLVHVPLCVVLAVAACLHIWAVHRF